MAAGTLVMVPLFLAVTYLPAGPDINLVIPFIGSAPVPLTLFVVIFLLGAVFSLIPAVMWPSVAYIVEERRLGSAFALMTLCQQIGWMVVPPIVGLLNDINNAGPENTAGYAPSMWFYTGLATTGLFFAFKLWRSETGPNAHGLERITTKTGV